LRETLPHLIRVFARPRPAPRSVTFRSIDSRYSVFGWRVRIKRKALEFSRLSGARRGGFTLSGSGSAVVRTAPILAPDTSYRARIHTRLGTKARTIHSDSHGRARLHFVLGPANPKQEYLPGATTRVYRATVSMRPVTGSAAAGSPSRS